MMLFKLSARNIRKSMQNYLIYFATLILGVAIFYVFNALGSQTVMLKVSSNTEEIINLMNEAMSVVSVFVSVVLGFLVVYASTFLMKRRKKEFGIYLTLGMGKTQVAKILVIETLLIGVISLVIGLLLGIGISQGMSVVTANLFEADMTNFQFMVSTSAIIKTIIYFAIMYVIVMALDVIIVSRAKLINLLYAGAKAQKNHAKNPVVCVLVFIIAAILLGTAYYKVTAGVRTISDFQGLGIQIAKGIIGTFLVFWSVSGMLLAIVKRCRRFYYKGINSFSVKELGSRINTTVFSGGIICLLLFFTICILSSAMAIRNSMNHVLETCTPVDVQVSKLYSYDAAEDYDMTGHNVEENLKACAIDTSKLTDMTEMILYAPEEIRVGDFFGKAFAESGSEDYFKEASMETMHIGDYNAFVSSFGGTTIDLAEDEYVILCNYGEMEPRYNEGLAEGQTVTIKGKTYHPKYSTCVDGIVHISNSESNAGVLLVPDSVDMSDCDFWYDIYSANYNTTDQTEVDALNEYYSDAHFYKLQEAKTEAVLGEDGSYYSMNCETSKRLRDNSVGLTAMIVFIGIYLGVVFLISGAAILSLKELSEAADSKEKYRILRRIGVDEKKIRHSLLAQSGVFFAMPLLLAIVHSVFGMQTAMFILTAFGRGGLLGSILLAAAVILVIYGIYFVITYICSRKIISE